MGTISDRSRSGNPLPFAAVPHEINADRRLNRTDYAVVGKLLEYAWQDDHTTVSDGRMAKDMGVDVATVQRALRRLDAAGWIRRRNRPTGPHNRTGREIVLCWRLPDFEVPQIALADGTSDGRISGRVCAKMPSRLRKNAEPTAHECVTTKIVVVEGVKNSIPPQTPHSNDNDPDPGPAVIAFPMADEPHRELVEDLGGSLAVAVDLAGRPDEDAEAAETAPRVYPMAGFAGDSHVPPDWAEARQPEATFQRFEKCDSHVPPDWAEALLLASDKVEAKAVTGERVGNLPTLNPKPRANPAQVAPPESYTATQLEFLAGLTEAQRARFDELSPGKRREVIAPHAHRLCDDPAHRSETARALAPRRSAAAFKPVLTVEDAVEAIVAGSRPATAMLATLLAREFADQKSWPFFDQVGGLLLEYPASAAGFLDALRQARNPGAKNPGAVLVHALKRDHGW